MLLNRSGVKRLAIESIIALSLAWASLQLGQVYASEQTTEKVCGEGLTALQSPSRAMHHKLSNPCQQEPIASE